MSKGRRILVGAVSASATLCLTLALCASALSGTANAAMMDSPSASMAFAASSVAAGASPVLTYLTAGTPAGSVIYLEETSGSGQAWQPVARVSATSGTVKAPADQAGTYSYRIVVAKGNHVLAASAPETLTVTGAAAPGGSSADGCTACTVAKDALPLLTPFIEPVITYVVQQVAPSILAFLASIFAF